MNRRAFFATLATAAVATRPRAVVPPLTREELSDLLGTFARLRPQWSAKEKQLHARMLRRIHLRGAIA